VEGTAGAGKEMQVKVTYDGQNKVDVVELLKDERWIHLQTVGSAPSTAESKK
jgi:hypothetical protein